MAVLGIFLYEEVAFGVNVRCERDQFRIGTGLVHSKSLPFVR